MSKISIKNYNGNNITLAAVEFRPSNFEESKKYAALVVAHPGGGVKEQTASLYAGKLAELAGLITIAFDASYQGESTGEPRQLENPYVRTEDISAVIDYLTTLPYVDNERIGAFGVCAGGAYSANAAINDKRIKAVGGVSAVNIGAMFRNGWDGSAKDVDALPTLSFGGSIRTSDAEVFASGKGELGSIPFAPVKREDAPNAELAEAYDYYRTPRAQHPNAPGFFTSRNLTQLLTYDAFNFAEVYLTQPIQYIAGSAAGSKWMSEDLVKRAASKKKNLHVIEGANHMQLYDNAKYVEEGVAVLTKFFKENL